MVQIYDCTLRDGAQTPGIKLPLKKKLEITKILDDFGMDYIEGGFPYSKPGDIEYFRMVKGYDLKKSRIAAFGRVGREKNPKNDKNLRLLKESDADAITIFGRSWDHSAFELPDNYPALIKDSIDYLKETGKEVFYDAEHFFDGYKRNPEFAMKALEAAKDADILVLCDTNGGCFPEEIYEITKNVKENIKNPLGIHCHNDSGLATANSLAALNAGVYQIQGTINNLGERTGNANLVEILVALYKKNILPSDIDLGKLTETSRKIERISGIRVPDNAPYAGKDAFRHKGGLHVDVIKRDPRTYEHIDPEVVGNKRSYEVSDQSGKENIILEAERLGFSLKRDDPITKKILARIKEEETTLEEAQFYLLLNRELNHGPEPFEVLDYKIVNYHDRYPEAKVEVRVDNEIRDGVSVGDGPVNAFDNALKKALKDFYGNEIKNIRLTDYFVKLPPTEMGTGAEVETIIEFISDGEKWGSSARSTDQDKAGINALIDGYKYIITKNKKK